MQELGVMPKCQQWIETEAFHNNCALEEKWRLSSAIEKQKNWPMNITPPAPQTSGIELHMNPTSRWIKGE